MDRYSTRIGCCAWPWTGPCQSCTAQIYSDSEEGPPPPKAIADGSGATFSYRTKLPITGPKASLFVAWYSRFGDQFILVLQKTLLRHVATWNVGKDKPFPDRRLCWTGKRRLSRRRCSRSRLRPRRLHGRLACGSGPMDPSCVHSTPTNNCERIVSLRRGKCK